MAITQRGSATTGTTTTGTTVTATKPSGVVSGDVLIATFTTNNQDGTPPSGWTQFVDEVIEVFRLQCYYKVAGGSEPSSYQFDVAADAPLVLTITAWQGVDNADVFDIDAVAEAVAAESEPYTTPQLAGTGATSGRVMYTRSVREVSSSVPSFTESSGTASELSDDGVFSGGSVSYANGFFADTADYTTTATKPGLAITCSVTEEHNIAATWALKASGIPGVLDVDMLLPQVDMPGDVSHGAVMDVVVPLTQVQMDGQASPPSGTMDTVIALPVVAMDGILPTEGSLDTVVPIGMEVQAETRYFGDNVITVESEVRVVQVVDGDITPSVIYFTHPGHLIRQPFAGHVSVLVSAMNTAFDKAPSELVGGTAAAFQPLVSAGQFIPTPSVSGTAVANNATVRVRPNAQTVTADVS